MKNNDQQKLVRMLASYVKKSKRYVRLIGKESSQTLLLFHKRIMRLSEKISAKYREIYGPKDTMRKFPP